MEIIPSGPIGIRSDRFDKFPTIWVVLCSRISDRNPSGSDSFRLENVGHRQDLNELSDGEMAEFQDLADREGLIADVDQGRPEEDDMDF